MSAVETKKSLSSGNLAAAAAGVGNDARRLPASPFRDMENDEDAQFVACVEEMRLSPVISRRGFLNFLEEDATGWVKLWVVSIGALFLLQRSTVCYFRCKAAVTTASRLRFDGYSTAIRRPFDGYSTAVRRLFDSYLTAIRRLFDGYSTAIRRPFDGYSTAIRRRRPFNGYSRLFDGYSTAVRRLFDGYLTAIRRLFDGYLTAIRRPFDGYSTAVRLPIRSH